MTCKKCGTVNDGKHRFCISCGEPMTEAAEAINAAVNEASSPAQPASSVAFDAIKKSTKSAVDIVKSGVDTVSGAVSEVDISKIVSGETIKSAQNKAKGLGRSGADFFKGFVSHKFFKLGIIIAIVLVILTGVGFGAFAFAGRDILQAIQGEEKYARSKVVSIAEDWIFLAIDGLEELSAASDASGSEYEISLSADISEGAIDELFGDYISYDPNAFELLKILGSSQLQLKAQMDSTSKNSNMSMSGNWKVKGEELANADITLQGNNLYVTAPMIYDDTIGIDVDGIMGFNGMNSFNPSSLISGFIAAGFDVEYLPYYIFQNNSSAQTEKALSKLKNYTPKLKPAISKMLKEAVKELDLSVENVVSVEINDKTAKFDTIVISVTEQDLMNALAAALEVAIDDSDFISLLSSITKDFSSLDIGLDSMSTSAITRLLKDTISDIQDSQYFDSDNAFDILLYIDSNNALRGIDIPMSYSEYESTGFVFKPGVGFKMYSGEGMRLYGDMKLGLSIKGDVNLYYSDGYDIIEGKLCDYKLSGGLKKYNIQVDVKSDDLIDLYGSNETYMYGDVYSMLSAYEGIDATILMKGSRNGAETAITVAIPEQKSKVSLTAKAEFDKKVNITVKDKVKKYSLYELGYQLDLGKLRDNLDTITEKLEKKGFDVYEIVDELLSGIY